MCRLSKEMEKNGDEISNISSVDNQVMKDNHDRADIIKDKDMQEEELPMELQQALHLTSGSDANSLQANSNNSSRESFTSSPDQSAEHYHQQLLNTHGHNHNHNNDHNLEAEGHNLVGNNSCNSTHIYNNMLIADEVCSSTPFFLPKSAWPASKSSLDEPIFFSSSILNSSHIPDPSSMSNSMPKATPTLHSLANLPAENMQQRTLPFYHHTNNTLQFIEGGYHHIPYDHNASNMNDPEYPYSSMPSYSSYLISPYLQPEKINHVDFLSGDGTADCGLYQSQYLQGDDQTSYMEYHNISQAQNWHNVMQQDGHEGACTSYWTPTSHGMIPVMPISHPSNYALNSIDLQAELHFNVQQGGHVPMLSHSQSLPIYLNHFGTQQSMINLANPTNHIAQNNGSPTEGLGSFLTASTLNELSGCRNQLRKPNCKDSSCASAVEEDQEAAGQELSCEGGGANYWKMQQGMKGMPKPSNKRQSPDEEEDDLHDCAPPLKRSASWNCMQSYNNTSPTIDPTLKPYEGSCKTSPKQDKPRARQGIANDPQSIAARHRRERISERLKILQQLVPNGSKVDLVTMLEKAINYVKFLQLQVKVLATDEYWPTPLNKFPKVAAMTMLAESKEPTMENVGKALETLVET